MNRPSAKLLGVLGLVLTTVVFPAKEVHAQQGLDLDTDTLTQSVLIHPPIDVGEDHYYLSSWEHPHKPHLRLGDQLGRDFWVRRVGDDGIPRTYRPGTGGANNEDWYGWRRAVLAPFEATVSRVTKPDTVNAPGTMNREAQPGLVIFVDASEGISVIYTHVREVSVEEGEAVEVGEVVAKVGNNGNSRAPHLHVAAWKGEASRLGAKEGVPLQIQVDLYAEERGEDSTEQ